MQSESLKQYIAERKLVKLRYDNQYGNQQSYSQKFILIETGSCQYGSFDGNLNFFSCSLEEFITLKNNQLQLEVKYPKEKQIALLEITDENLERDNRVKKMFISNLPDYLFPTNLIRYDIIHTESDYYITRRCLTKQKITK